MHEEAYLLRQFALAAETPAERLTRAAELTERGLEVLMGELGWLPFEITQLARPAAAEADRL